MTSPDVLPKGYTHEPEQHPKLILGSLQLLLWLVFRPSAWINHLERIDPALVTNYFFSKPISRLQSRNLALRRLLIQAYLVLPILANLAISLVLWVLGESVENITVSLAFGLTLGVGLSVVYRVTYGMALSVAWGVGSGVVSVLALKFASVVATHFAPVLAWVLALGVVLGVVSGVVSGVALIKKSGFLSGLKGLKL